MASEGNAPSQNKAESVQGEKQPADERYYPPPLPGSIEVQFPRRIEENYNATQKKQDRREKWKIILEGLTVLFVFGSMVVSLYMWNEMRKATESATLSADAAAASTAAWIALQSFTYEGMEEDKFVFKVIFKNVGKTPATEVKSGWEFHFMPAPDFKLVPQISPWQCPKHKSGPAIVPPDGTWITMVKTSKYTAEQIKSVDNRIGRVFIHGCAIYRDVLSTNKDRITEVAFIYHSMNPELDTGSSLTIYDAYNRMK